MAGEKDAKNILHASKNKKKQKTSNICFILVNCSIKKDAVKQNVHAE